MSSNKKFKIVFNSPVVLTFSALCCIALVLKHVTHDVSTNLLFSVYNSSLSNVFTYLRFFGHVLGHYDINHLVNNITMILVIGPLLEDKYGGKNVVITILVTALVTGIVHFIFFPGIQLMGASGVVFAFILLASMTGFKSREIPVTLILVAIIYIGGQVIDGIFVRDNVSQLTHIIGGAVGAILGYIFGAKKSY